MVDPLPEILSLVHDIADNMMQAIPATNPLFIITGLMIEQVLKLKLFKNRLPYKD
jgi:hypothetical protein